MSFLEFGVDLWFACFLCVLGLLFVRLGLGFVGFGVWWTYDDCVGVRWNFC